MAKQNGILKIKGTVEDLTFLDTKDGHQVRKKRRAVSKETIATDPRYARLRENMSEFNRAANAAKLFRSAVQDVLVDSTDKKVQTRLGKAMMAVVISDPVSKRGMRNITDGKGEIIKGLNFNETAVLSVVLRATINAVIDRAAGKLTAEIPSFIPESKMTAPKGTTHFKIHSAGVEINFGNNLFITKVFESAGFLVGTDPTPVVNIVHDIPVNSTNPLFLLVGIRFYQEVNGTLYSLKSGAYNALTVMVAESAP